MTDAKVDDKADAKGKATEAKMLKAVGGDATTMSFNAETNTLATWQGGKYRMSADGKKLVHLMGPAPVGDKKADEDK